MRIHINSLLPSNLKFFKSPAMVNNKNKISNRAIKKMHQKTRKLKFFAIFNLLTYVFPLFLLILVPIAGAQERSSGYGVHFNHNNFALDLPDGFERRSTSTSGVILSIRYRGSFPTLNIVESPGSSKYPSHLKVEQRVLESYKAVGIQEPKLLSVNSAAFGSINLSEPLVILGYNLNDEELKAEVGFINLKSSYLTITLVERASAKDAELNAGLILRENLRWVGKEAPADYLHNSSLSGAQRSDTIKSFIKQMLGILGIVAGVFILVKLKKIIWKRIFK